MATTYSLRDRYLAETGRLHLSGIQALVRIPIEALRADRRAGRRTAAFVSGYPGSPLGGFDQEMARAREVAGDVEIVHLPAVNEELGATAVMGSQLAAVRPDRRHDGVVGVWYGKAPGLDRATDALRHATFAGSSATGGAIALVGDDPACKSSTMPSSSDASLVDLHMPILYPGSVAECLELGLHGVAMSRVSGLWSALKVVTPIADASGTVDLPALGAEPVLPETFHHGRPWVPHPSAQFLGPRMLEVEEEFHEVRLEAARRYGELNGLNRTTVDPPDAWIGCIATGYTYYELREALRRLGLGDDAAIAGAGIRLMQLKMPVPFDAGGIARFARGLEEIVVVEEKYPTLEQMVRDALYPTPLRPAVSGKRAPDGTPLLPSYGLMDADAILPGLRARLRTRLADRLAPLPAPRERIALAGGRIPFFCSGCPHNWGTKVPDGAVVGMGTGCHGMTLLMDESRVGESIGITAMGNEGAQWLGMAPFVETRHVFQNLGDGTYFHSGQLAVQAAVGAGATMTFKLLHNSAVAMTGGQTPSHKVGVPELATILLAHGVAAVAVSTDDPDRYRKVRLPEGVQVADRRDIVALQERLAAIDGVTVLIHDQECAAELRRARNRGRLAAPRRRVVINHRICEGCGDCGDVSSCLSVQPFDTPLGRKTRIDQESCNFDASCLAGDCPAFMTVEGEAVAGHGPVPPGEHLVIGAPPAPEAPRVRIRFAGIGGTGVVSAAQIVGTAAMLDGWDVDGLDQTGLSQKAGPVVSDLTLTRDGVEGAKLIGEGEADVLVAFDQLVAASPATLRAATDAKTVTIASTTVTPTGTEVVDPNRPRPDPAGPASLLGATSLPGAYVALDAARAASALTGRQATANLLLVGVAVQRGDIPVSPERMRDAIELNGVAVEANLAAFDWGRRYAVHPESVEAEVRARTPAIGAVGTDPLPAPLARRVDGLGLDADAAATVTMLASDLVAYQDRAYAGRFLDLVASAAETERRLARRPGGLCLAVARGYHKLLAYKDEYEVARLMLSADGLAEARALAGGGAKVTWHLHPPTLAGLGMRSKVRFGPASAPLFALLARGKRLRGTPLDPFGRSDVRVLERRLPVEYAEAMTRLLGALGRLDGEPEGLRHQGLAEVTAIAALPEAVRGYEDLKRRRADAYREELARRVEAFTRSEGLAPAPT